MNNTRNHFTTSTYQKQFLLLKNEFDDVSISGYNSFGMNIPTRTWNSSSIKDYKYGFNGKEKNNEIKSNDNSYDFGARLYDNRLGRWMSVDPLQIEYTSLFPYCFGGNNPIIPIDNDSNRIKFINSNSKSKYSMVPHANRLKLSKTV